MRAARRRLPRGVPPNSRARRPRRLRARHVAHTRRVRSRSTEMPIRSPRFDYHAIHSPLQAKRLVRGVRGRRNSATEEGVALNQKTQKRQKLALAARWALQVLLAAGFVSIGLGKFGSPF